MYLLLYGIHIIYMYKYILLEQCNPLPICNTASDSFNVNTHYLKKKKHLLNVFKQFYSSEYSKKVFRFRIRN